MKSYLLLIFFAILFGCVNSQSNKVITLFFSSSSSTLPFSENGTDSNLITPEKIKKEGLSGQAISFRGENIYEIHSYKEGEIWGEELQSFSNGGIMQYVFRVDSINSTFYRRYNSKKEIIDEEGTPLVYKLIGNSNNGNSLDVKFVFIDRVFKDIDVDCNINGAGYRKIKLEEDAEFLPYKTFHYVADVSKQDRVVLLFRMNCEETNGEIKSYNDTLDLSRK